jgi:hypothetical protein
MKQVRLSFGTALVTIGAVFALAPGVSTAATFSNPAPVTINDYDVPTSCSPGPDAGQATPYPSQIQVSGLGTPVTDVNATISGYSHGYPNDVRMLLVGPQGQTADLMDEAGGSSPVSDLTITFDDAATDPVPDPAVSGTFKPTQAALGCTLTIADDFPAPAPAHPYGADLAGFNGVDPNGTWSLYVVDDANEDSGSISGGWSLDIAAPAAVQPSTTNPNCEKLRKKLKRQKNHLAKASTDKKRAMFKANIADTQRRLKRLGC